MKKASKIEIERRRQWVGRYTVRGIPARRIAEIEKVGIRTIHRDIATVRKEIQSRIAKDDIVAYFTEYCMTVDEVNRELWGKYGRCDGEETLGIALGYLQAIAKNERTKIEAGQRLGIVFEAPKTLEVYQKVEGIFLDAIEKEDPEVAKRIIGRIAEEITP